MNLERRYEGPELEGPKDSCSTLEARLYLGHSLNRSAEVDLSLYSRLDSQGSRKETRHQWMAPPATSDPGPMPPTSDPISSGE